jgi:DNA-binding Lrp family transcriptional regulator
MPFQLDDYDVAILKELMRDGRKSFREISRESGITTPTVRARLERLINVGFVKSVSPIFDFGVVEKIFLKMKIKARIRSDTTTNNLEIPNLELRKG